MTAAVFCRSCLFSGVSSNSVVSENFESSDDPGTRQRNRSRSLPPLGRFNRWPAEPARPGLPKLPALRPGQRFGVCFIHDDGEVVKVRP
jgi:hypothetical protein